MAYEVWDRQAANLLGEYETEDAALAVVLRSVRSGTVAAERLALACEDEAGETRSVASGTALVERAAAVADGKRGN